MRCREEQVPLRNFMGEFIVSLRGWHPALAQAELKALFPEGNVKMLRSPRLAQLSTSSPVMDFSISAGIEAIFEDGVNTEWINESVLLEEIKQHLNSHPHNGTMCAVHSWKHGQGIAGCSRTALAGKVGGLLSKTGAPIDLENPQRTFGLLFDGRSQTVTYGWLMNHGPKADSSTERRASQRPFFKPVSLEPRLARLAVNLACGPRSGGGCLDPMTGTGGFTIEAVLSQRYAIGMDLDHEMIQGAQRNLEWAGSTKNPFVVGDATEITATLDDDAVSKCSGIVLDPPYGRNSQGSMGQDKLLNSVLKSTTNLPCSGLVLILPTEPRKDCLDTALPSDLRPELKHQSWNELEKMLTETGWSYRNAWYVSVHGSLGRVVVHATRSRD